MRAHAGHSHAHTHTASKKGSVGRRGGPPALVVFYAPRRLDDLGRRDDQSPASARALLSRAKFKYTGCVCVWMLDVDLWPFYIVWHVTLKFNCELFEGQRAECLTGLASARCEVRRGVVGILIHFAQIFASRIAAYFQRANDSNQRKTIT